MRLTRKRFRGGVLAAAMLVGGGGALALGATPAGASNRQVTAAGSFTTYQLMHDLFPTSLNDLLPGGTTAHQRVLATPTFCSAVKTHNGTSTSTYGVRFTTTTVNPGGVPNGSGAGKSYLKSEETAAITRKGCVTIGRSSSPPKSTTASTHFDYYAYALDGVAIMLGTNAGGTPTAPTTISLQQVKNIYSCVKLTTTGTVPVTTWAEAGLGSSTTTINRFWPQPGSGTRTVYTSILGFTPTKSAVVPKCPAPAPTSFANVRTVANSKTVLSVPNEENTESGLIYATKVTAAHKTIKNDIYVYSAGKFVSQWNNPTQYGGAGKRNRINGTTTIGNFTSTNVELALIRQRKATGATTAGLPGHAFVNLVASSPKRTGLRAVENTTTVKEQNEWFSHIPAGTTSHFNASLSTVPGVRYVYNVCDTALPGYNTCKAMVGFDNQLVATPNGLTTQTTGAGTKSRLCAGNDSATIIAAGFIPLTKSSGPSGPGGSSNVPLSTCREFPGKALPGHASKNKAWTFNTWVNPTV